MKIKNICAILYVLIAGLSIIKFIDIAFAGSTDGRTDVFSVGNETSRGSSYTNEIFRIKATGDVVPGTSNVYNLGSSTETWLRVHASTLTVTSATVSNLLVTTMTLVRSAFTDTTTSTSIVPTHSFLVLQSTGGNIVLDSTPRISTAGATPGQWLVLKSSPGAQATITLSTAPSTPALSTGLQLSSSAYRTSDSDTGAQQGCGTKSQPYSRVISSNTILSLIYDGNGFWQEVSCQDND